MSLTAAPELELRPVAAADAVAVRTVTTAAFGRADEALLVEQLRADGDVVFERLAVLAGAPVGHVLLSRMTGPLRALALAPVSVVPERQGQGVGAALVTAALAGAAAADWQAVFVLGDLAYYGRFGFRADLAAGFSSPYAGPHFAAVALQPWPVQAGDLSHAPAFGG